MRSIVLDPSFASWRASARTLLIEGVHPRDVDWQESDASATVFGTVGRTSGPADPNAPKPPKIAGTFLRMLETAACYRAPDRWPFLYRALWRWTQGDRAVASGEDEDEDGHRLRRMIKAVQTEETHMRKVLRFRHRDPSLGPPEFISWFEPVHDLLEHAAMHFATRMGNATWMIATPHSAAFWDGALLRVDRTSEPEEKPADFGEPAGMNGEAVSGDAIEALWLAYYESTFTTALENAAKMASHMPVRYWKSPPDDRIDPTLISRADPYSRRDRHPRNVPSDMEVTINTDLEPIKGTLLNAPPSLAECKRCALWRNATQPVAGIGPANARVMLVGEQPGDQEDREGTPFVGPAGKLLDEAIAEAGLSRESLYLTNAVKHFKWETRGSDDERLHSPPAQRKREACRYWLDEELNRIAPKVVVALGATALKALTGHRTALSEYLGKTIEHKGRIVVPTYHPSYLLRVTDEKIRAEVFGTLVEALVFAQQIADGTATIRTPVKGVR
ncbi:Uracil-DNA glycosylase, putative family 6 [Candidatus Burkholderia verschuerenii]|uniref:Type-4 uracil-DNA glycosylase n=1 Tax=Candidatus Burkholderia verschuerenii TaxID=242163 RepID=A0A0L0MFK3_9BURK|nr:UdgX family uracil-DNA binding protein [Candidatus Burkholderia verschuerenii]KND60754.1 Uracil-DNA glycosylase, putative family 6 [Candidatus Burkholderia verschuerenii]